MVLILLALALARSPERPGRLLVPKPREDNDFDLELLELLEDRLVVDAGEDLGAEVAVVPVEGVPDTTTLGLFSPVLLVAEADSLSVVPLSRGVLIQGSEGSLDIIGGLGGRADVNLCCESLLLVERDEGTAESALVFFLSSAGDGRGDSFFSRTGES